MSRVEDELTAGNLPFNLLCQFHVCHQIRATHNHIVSLLTLNHGLCERQDLALDDISQTTKVRSVYLRRQSRARAGS